MRCAFQTLLEWRRVLKKFSAEVERYSPRLKPLSEAAGR